MADFSGVTGGPAETIGVGFGQPLRKGAGSNMQYSNFSDAGGGLSGTMGGSGSGPGGLGTAYLGYPGGMPPSPNRGGFDRSPYFPDGDQQSPVPAGFGNFNRQFGGYNPYMGGLGGLFGGMGGQGFGYNPMMGGFGGYGGFMPMGGFGGFGGGMGGFGGYGGFGGGMGGFGGYGGFGGFNPYGGFGGGMGGFGGQQRGGFGGSQVSNPIPSDNLW